MKFATYHDGSRDGQLMIVSKDLKTCVSVSEIVANLQLALDDWDAYLPEFNRVYERLNHGKEEDILTFNSANCMSPLPRSYQWVDGSAYVNHVELVRRARGAELPDSFWTDPLMYQGGSDSFLGPYDDIIVADEKWGIDFEGEISVITGDVPMGVSVDDALEYVKLIMLVNDVSLRGLIPAELQKGFGFLQSKPSSAFSPVAVTPESLGEVWSDGKLNLPLKIWYNDALFGSVEAGEEMTFSFADLIAHAAKTRPLAAGTIIGSGTVSNKYKDKDGVVHPGRPVSDGGRGYSCIAEIRMIETIRSGQAETGFMKYGDKVKIEMFDRNGQSIFGAINQTVKPTEI